MNRTTLTIFALEQEDTNLCNLNKSDRLRPRRRQLLFHDYMYVIQDEARSCTISALSAFAVTQRYALKPRCFVFVTERGPTAEQDETSKL